MKFNKIIFKNYLFILFLFTNKNNSGLIEWIEKNPNTFLFTSLTSSFAILGFFNYHKNIQIYKEKTNNKILNLQNENNILRNANSQLNSRPNNNFIILFFKIGSV